MVSGLNNVDSLIQSTFQPQIFQRRDSIKSNFEPINSFAEEDQAIISSEAKLMSELDKFNSGGDNAVELALANVMAKFTVSAEVNIIQTKKNMLDDILNMGS